MVNAARRPRATTKPSRLFGQAALFANFTVGASTSAASKVAEQMTCSRRNRMTPGSGSKKFESLSGRLPSTTTGLGATPLAALLLPMNHAMASSRAGRSAATATRCSGRSRRASHPTKPWADAQRSEPAHCQADRSREISENASTAVRVMLSAISLSAATLTPAATRRAVECLCGSNGSIQ